MKPATVSPLIADTFSGQHDSVPSEQELLKLYAVSQPALEFLRTSETLGKPSRWAVLTFIQQLIALEVAKLMDIDPDQTRAENKTQSLVGEGAASKGVDVHGRTGSRASSTAMQQALDSVSIHHHNIVNLKTIKVNSSSSSDQVSSPLTTSYCNGKEDLKSSSTTSIDQASKAIFKSSVSSVPATRSSAFSSSIHTPPSSTLAVSLVPTKAIVASLTAEQTGITLFETLFGKRAMARWESIEWLYWRLRPFFILLVAGTVFLAFGMFHLSENLRLFCAILGVLGMIPVHLWHLSKTNLELYKLMSKTYDYRLVIAEVIMFYLSFWMVLDCHWSTLVVIINGIFTYTCIWGIDAVSVRYKKRIRGAFYVVVCLYIFGFFAIYLGLIPRYSNYYFHVQRGFVRVPIASKSAGSSAESAADAFFPFAPDSEFMKRADPIIAPLLPASGVVIECKNDCSCAEFTFKSIEEFPLEEYVPAPGCKAVFDDCILKYVKRDIAAEVGATGATPITVGADVNYGMKQHISEHSTSAAGAFFSKSINSEPGASDDSEKLQPIAYTSSNGIDKARSGVDCAPGEPTGCGIAPSLEDTPTTLLHAAWERSGANGALPDISTSALGGDAAIAPHRPLQIMQQASTDRVPSNENSRAECGNADACTVDAKGGLDGYRRYLDSSSSSGEEATATATGTGDTAATKDASWSISVTDFCINRLINLIILACKFVYNAVVHPDDCFFIKSRVTQRLQANVPERNSLPEWRKPSSVGTFGAGYDGQSLILKFLHTHHRTKASITSS